MTRVGAQQKGQLNTPGMASLMVHGKQVMVQGSPAMIQGQATFIPSQGPIIPNLQGAQTAILQGGSIFVQGQPANPQGQAVMLQGQPGKSSINGALRFLRKRLKKIIFAYWDENKTVLINSFCYA